MGTIYEIACYDCKITRDLDQYYPLRTVKNRTEALAYSEEIKIDSFRAALAISFMDEHRGHKCTILNEHDEEHDAIMEEIIMKKGTWREDTYFWREAK